MEKTMSDTFSPRQLDILRWYICGLTYQEIADKFGITKNGVRWNLDDMVENQNERLNPTRGTEYLSMLLQSSLSMDSFPLIAGNNVPGILAAKTRYVALAKWLSARARI